jgi:transitional endoplasmic reticulum ATPase
MVTELHVAPLSPQDAGKGIARIPRVAMEELGITSGDIVQLTGRRQTVAKALPAYEPETAGVIRIDGNVRTNLNVGTDEPIEVSKAEPKPAESITIALPQYTILRGAEPFIHRHLLERPVIRGDSVHMRLLGQPFVFLVTRTSPSGPVVITEETEFAICLMLP